MNDLKSGLSYLQPTNVILALILPVLMYGCSGEGSPERSKNVRQDVVLLAAAVRLYRYDHGRLPDESEGLNALLKPTSNRPNGYLKRPDGYLKSIPKDKWGRRYRYKILEDGDNQLTFEICSYGSDGKPGGEGKAKDICRQ